LDGERRLKSIKRAGLSLFESMPVTESILLQVESMLPMGQAIDFVVARDCHNFNLGAFILRASESALKFLDEIYSGKHVDKELLEHYHWEQKSFITMFENSDALRNKTLIVSQKMFNTYLTDGPCNGEGGVGWSHGDFAVHFPGSDDEFREKTVSEYVRKIVY
jgi:hypothetical protein